MNFGIDIKKFPIKIRTKDNLSKTANSGYKFLTFTFSNFSGSIIYNIHNFFYITNKNK